MTDLETLRRLIKNDQRNFEYATGNMVPTDSVLRVLADCAVRYMDAWGQHDVHISQDATENFTDAVNLYRERMGMR
jgi:hypothetical protein